MNDKDAVTWAAEPPDEHRMKLTVPELSIQSKMNKYTCLELSNTVSNKRHCVHCKFVI